MSSTNGTPARRERVERNIYKRRGADGRDRFELSYRDSSGKQRFRMLPPGTTKTQARAERDAILGAKGKGEHVQPNPKLRFGQAADRWLAEQVAQLRPTTRDIYGNAVRVHLEPRWGKRRMDSLDVDDAAQLVRELRAKGLAERSIGGIVQVASRVFTFARRRMSWHGTNPIPLMENGERPKTTTRKRRIYQGAELAQTLEAAGEPWRTLFALAAVTGARLSELLALTWQEVELSDPDAACVHISQQVDRQGQRQELKTDSAQRTVELPRSLVALLLEHKARSLHSQDAAHVFATKSGRPIGQRNVTRALRRAQTKARTSEGKPTFPALFEPHQNADGRWLPRKGPLPAGSVPSFHGFRHTAASYAIAAGDSAEEVSWQLGHKHSGITRQVYIQEVKSAERRAKMRSRLEARHGSMLAGLSGSTLEATAASSEQQTATEQAGKVLSLRQRAAGSSSQ